MPSPEVANQATPVTTENGTADSSGQTNAKLLEDAQSKNTSSDAAQALETQEQDFVHEDPFTGANAKMLDEAQSSYKSVERKKSSEQDFQQLNFDSSIYQLPTEVKVGEKTVKLPEGITNYELKDGLPSYTKNGVTVDLNEKGEAKAYHSKDFSFEHHEDNDTWYYHENKEGSKYVQIDVPTLNEDGSVSTKEHGGFNNGREHKLSADGQSSESLASAKLGRVADQLELGKLGDAIKNRSVSDVFSWAKENPGAFGGLSLGTALIDGIAGTNTHSTANAFIKGIGDTLIDGTVNGTVYLAGLAQGGLEKIPGAPDLKQIDQVIPKLDLYEGYSEAANSGSEKVAYRIGQVGGFLIPFAGQASGAVRLSKSAVEVVKEGRVLSTLSDEASKVGTKISSKFKPKNVDEAVENPTATKVVSERLDQPLTAAPLPELNMKPMLALESGSKPSVRAVNDATLPPRPEVKPVHSRDTTTSAQQNFHPEEFDFVPRVPPGQEFNPMHAYAWDRVPRTGATPVRTADDATVAPRPEPKPVHTRETATPLNARENPEKFDLVPRIPPGQEYVPTYAYAFDRVPRTNATPARQADDATLPPKPEVKPVHSRDTATPAQPNLRAGEFDLVPRIPPGQEFNPGHAYVYDRVPRPGNNPARTADETATTSKPELRNARDKDVSVPAKPVEKFKAQGFAVDDLGYNSVSKRDEILFRVGNDSYKLGRTNQQWFYGGRGLGHQSPVKVHVSTDSPQDLAKIQEVLIPALNKDPELSRLVGDWKTFDPRWATQPETRFGSAPDGIKQGAKGFTIYPENAQDAAKIQERIDSILAQRGLGIDAPIKSGNVDRIAGSSNRTGIVRDHYEFAQLDNFKAGAVLPTELARAITAGLRPGTRLTDDALRQIEKTSGIYENTLVYDQLGRLSLKAQSVHSGFNPSNGLAYLDESQAFTQPGHLSDRKAIYKLANDYKVLLA